jgi:tRNA 2-thiocytidine biosynthesis protein TtcA
MCSLCSRLRRGILYRVADELGATKVALGHHRDDILETFFLNLFFAGQLKSMPPRLVSDDGRHVVIRPLAYVKEADLSAYARWREFPIIPCTLCGSQENLKRREAKLMLRDWEKRFPGRVENIFSSLSRVTPSHLMDRNLFDFAAAVADGVPSSDGDIAFDVDPVLDAPALPVLTPDGLRGGLPDRVRASFTIAREPVSPADTSGFRPSDSEQTESEHN